MAHFTRETIKKCVKRDGAARLFWCTANGAKEFKVARYNSTSKI
jgi:hypothetical protein